MVEDAAVDRSRDGVVDDQRQARGVRRVGPGADVDDVQLRVADRLREHQPCLVVDQPGDGVGVVRIGPADLDPVLRERVGEQVVRAAVERRDGDDVVAGARHVQHRVGDGRLARRGRDCREPTLERGDALLEHVPRRVHDPRVDVPRHGQREQVGGVLGVVEHERRRLVDRHRPRLRRRVRRLPAVESDRLRPQFRHGSFPLFRPRSAAEQLRYRRSLRPGAPRRTAASKCIASGVGDQTALGSGIASGRCRHPLPPRKETA